MLFAGARPDMNQSHPLVHVRPFPLVDDLLDELTGCGSKPRKLVDVTSIAGNAAH